MAATARENLSDTNTNASDVYIMFGYTHGLPSTQ